MSGLSWLQIIGLVVYIVLVVLLAAIPIYRDWQHRRTSVTVARETIVRIGGTFEMSGKRYTVTRIEGGTVTVVESLETLPDSHFSQAIQ